MELRLKFPLASACAVAASVIATTAGAEPLTSNAFRNGDMAFQSVLITKQSIRVNVSFTNKSEKPVYLWSSNYDAKCATVSLIDDAGNEFKCIGESLFTMTPYSRPLQGITVTPGNSVGLQYQFERGTAEPGKNFEFSAAPLLYVERDVRNANALSGSHLEYHDSETLGVNFSELPAKVRAAGTAVPAAK